MAVFFNFIAIFSERTPIYNIIILLLLTGVLPSQNKLIVNNLCIEILFFFSKIHCIYVNVIIHLI